MVSWDGGEDWREAARLAGPTPGHTAAFRFSDIPAGVRQALLRFELTGNNTVGIFNFRIDADYLDPKAAKDGRPFDVIFHWMEDGRARSQTARVTQLPFRFRIETAATPELVSVTCAMPTN
jgi:hypothetical protein